MKNACLKKLICLARPWIPLHASTNRFLIVATTALGDTLWATAAIESIKKERPDCHLAVLTSPIGMEILRYNTYANQLFSMKSREALRSAKRLALSRALKRFPSPSCPMRRCLLEERVRGSLCIQAQKTPLNGGPKNTSLNWEDV